MIGVAVNGDGNDNSRHMLGGGMGIVGGSNNGNISGPTHFSVAGSSSIGSNNMGNHNNKPINSGVWGTQSGSNVIATTGNTPCVNGGLNPNTLNPNANHGAWPQNPTPGPSSQSQRPSQVQGMSSKLGVASQQGPALAWGSMAAPNSSMMEDGDASNGTTSNKVLGSGNSGNGGLQPTNLNTESNGPNNTIMMNTTTTTNATVTSSSPNSIASPLLSGDCPWGSIGGGNGGPLANGNSSAPQQPQGELGGSGAFGTPWSANIYSGDEGYPNADTVNPPNPALMQAGNPQSSSTAAYKRNNNQNNTGAPRWDQGATSNPNQPQNNASWGFNSNQITYSAGHAPENDTQTTMGPPAGIPRPWGSSASSSSSSSSSSTTSNTKMSNSEWGSTTPCENNLDAGNLKGSSGNNGWRSLENDAMGIGAASSGNQGLGSVTGGWGRSGGSEGSGESSGGRSSSDKEGSQSKGGNRRKVTATAVTTLSQADMDPRVLSNSGWGQTPIRQNTAWDVTSTSENQHQGPRGHERKQSSTGLGWGTATPATSSQTTGGGGLFINNCGTNTYVRNKH